MKSQGYLNLKKNLTDIFHLEDVEVTPLYVGNDRREHIEHLSRFENKLFDLAKELIEISNQGLKNRMRLDTNGNDESSFLLPLIEMLDRRETLSDEMIRKFNSNWCGSVNPSFEDQII